MHWILSESRYLRFFSFSVFYVAQGLPIGLISIALPVYRAGEGASVGEIASFDAISRLPWGFAGESRNGQVLLPAHGRRRPRIVAAQFGSLIAMMSLGAVANPVNNIALLTWVAFSVNCFAPRFRMLL